MHKARILIVDDEKSIVQLIEMVLRKEGFKDIYAVFNAKDALEASSSFAPDIILLDVMLPDGSGFDLCPKIRQGSNAHIIFLTARASDLDVLTGFAIGGDDYVTKPFNPLEIAARIKARLRRNALIDAATGTAPPAASESRWESDSRPDNESNRRRYNFGRFVLDEFSGALKVEGREISCPAQVYQLLLFLCRNAGIVFSKSQLYEKVWGIDGCGDDHTVMVHIRKIRERIEIDPGNPDYLLTVRGLGYKLVRGTEG
ncbi:response regulator transcription factor [Paenibacillus herberti]|uniref:DNA-binding response regulator n=1 Tax=Paenibacillus herberti TaxID=1619309 RepID=A0A229NUX8_9BACL|nr:response regulator transcription factor [Paenibacillus herberti]OXM13630.1 DNA-binding response regulator [Paenibacillus herberti]